MDELGDAGKEIPKSKFQSALGGPEKFQLQKLQTERALVWRLLIGVSLDSGAWNLGLKKARAISFSNITRNGSNIVVPFQAGRPIERRVL